jgi:hypothetical protein
LALHPEAALASRILDLVVSAAGNKDNRGADELGEGEGEERDEMRRQTQGTGDVEGEGDDDDDDGHLEFDPYVGGEEFEYADDAEVDDDAEIEYMDNPYDQ